MQSPRWLVDHGKPAEALATLAKLHAHGDQTDPWVVAEFAQIQESVTFEHENEAKSYVELFRNRSSFRRLFIAVALQASVQMTGVSAIQVSSDELDQYYSVTIYGQIGISGQDTLKYQAINSIIALIAQFCCILLIDRFGRRWPLILGNLGNCITFIIATILIAMFPPGVANNRSAQWGFIIMTWIYNFSFSATCGPLSWIIPAEIFDTRTRSKGVSIATMTSFAFNTMIGQTTGIAFGSIGYRFYIVFIVCNFTNALFFWAILPETKGRTLESMTYLFTHSPWWVPGSRSEDYGMHDIDRKVEEIREKGGLVDDTREGDELERVKTE
ncbi:hypothetical protein MMC25_007145 [Agyrium rufum]|nr:hypothetical protein [Agyrium rufum]